RRVASAAGGDRCVLQLAAALGTDCGTRPRPRSAERALWSRLALVRSIRVFLTAGIGMVSHTPSRKTDLQVRAARVRFPHVIIQPGKLRAWANTGSRSSLHQECLVARLVTRMEGKLVCAPRRPVDVADV